MASRDGYELRLIENHLADGWALDTGPADINRVVYVVQGAIEIGERLFEEDTAWHGRGQVKISAAAGGTVIWQWELAPATSPEQSGSPSSRSHLKLRQALPWPIADSLLMRCDSVSFPPGGCAYLHTHQGPGIRCLIEGGIRIDTGGTSHSYGPGNAWFEAGPEPVFAQAAADRPSRFIRVMVLPARLKGQSSIAYVNAEDRDKPKSQRYKIYLDEPISV